VTARGATRADADPVATIAPAAGRRRRGGRRALAVSILVVLSLLLMAGLTALGVWQLERRVWKLELIDRVAQRIHALPEPLPEPSTWTRINAADDAYRRVQVTGRLLHDRETLVQAVTEHGGGYWVLTPLKTAAGATVLVNRGFVPPEWRDASKRNDLEPHGEVEVIGLMRMTEPKGAFLHNNNPASDRWYSRDIPAIAAARGLVDVAPFFLDADATPNAGGWPKGGLTVVVFANNHLVYALTWFVLALMLAGATIFVVREEWRLRKNDLDSDMDSATRHISGRMGQLGCAS
jgi:surfeit locus 1 family protein